VLFAGAALFAAPRRRAAIPLLLALWFILIGLGNHGDFSLYPLIKRLPLYRSLRNPTLYSFTGALFLILSAGYGLDALDGWLRGSRVRALRAAALVLVPLLALGNGVELASWGRYFLQRGVFGRAPITRVEQPFRQMRGNRYVQQLFAYVDRGSLSCYDETPWPASARLRSDLPQEEYLADPSAGDVRRVSWSPNRIVLSARLSRPATLLVNQNFQPGWRSSIGQARSEDGLLAVDLPAGEHEVVLRMWPSGVTVGLALMALALGVTALLVRSDRRRSDRGRRDAAPRSGADVAEH
jgi:hypothetical protein